MKPILGKGSIVLHKAQLPPIGITAACIRVVHPWVFREGIVQPIARWIRCQRGFNHKIPGRSDLLVYVSTLQTAMVTRAIVHVVAVLMAVHGRMHPDLAGSLARDRFMGY